MSIKDDFFEIRSQISHPAQLKLIVLLILTVGLFAPVLFSLIHTWSTSDDYSHGFFCYPDRVIHGLEKKRAACQRSLKSHLVVVPSLFSGGFSLYDSGGNQFPYTYSSLNDDYIVFSFDVYGWREDYIYFVVAHCIFNIYVPHTQFILYFDYESSKIDDN